MGQLTVPCGPYLDPEFFKMVTDYSAQVAIAKCHRLRGLKTTGLISHSSGSLKPQIKVWQGSISREGSLPAPTATYPLLAFPGSHAGVGG